MEKISHEMIICIVNTGFSGMVMEVARREGCMGGTILHARGTAIPEAEKKYKISINPEKDMIMIVVKSEIKDKILKAIYKEVGLSTNAQAIAFSLPVTDSVGLK